jgi:hypothetical protein
LAVLSDSESGHLESRGGMHAPNRIDFDHGV